MALPLPGWAVSSSSSRSMCARSCGEMDAAPERTQPGLLQIFIRSPYDLITISWRSQGVIDGSWGSSGPTRRSSGLIRARQGSSGLRRSSYGATHHRLRRTVAQHRRRCCIARLERTCERRVPAARRKVWTGEQGTGDGRAARCERRRHVG